MALEYSVPGFTGALYIAGAAIPANIAGGVNSPDNLVTPGVMGAFPPYHVAEGFANPTITATMLCRDIGNETLSTTLLSYFFTRGAPGFDTSYIPGGVEYWDGVRGGILHGAKADTFSIRVAKGQPLMGQDVRWLYDEVQFSGFWDATFSFSNNHQADMGNDGASVVGGPAYPRAQRASTPQASVSAQRLSTLGLATDNFGTEASLRFTIVGSNGKTCTFFMPRVRDMIRKNISAGMPQSMKPCQFMAFGLDSRAVQVGGTSAGF